MPMIQKAIVSVLATRIVQVGEGRGGMFSWSNEVARRMFQSQTPTDMVCPACQAAGQRKKGQKGSKQPIVYCCTTTTDAKNATVICFCAHICAKHGIIGYSDETFWLGEDRKQQPRCLICSGVARLFRQAA
jgi:hypothetical protein